MSRLKTIFFLLIGFLLFTGSVFQPLHSTRAETRTEKKILKVGLMVSASPDIDPAARELVQAATLALMHLNGSETARSGNIQLQLAVRAGEGEWGSASRQSVELIFDEEVLAIAGALDGENAHLTQMAVAKSHLVYLETKAADVTLSEVNIPYFFRFSASDKQQSEVILHHLLNQLSLRSLLLVTGSTFDDAAASREFKRQVQSYSGRISITELIESDQISVSELSGALERSRAEAILVLGDYSLVNRINYAALKSGLKVPLIANGSFLTSRSLQKDAEPLHPDYFICPDPTDMKRMRHFMNAFHSEFGLVPGMQAAFLYDAVTLLGRAILAGNWERENLREYLSNLTLREMVTGNVQFNDRGDNRVAPSLCRWNETWLPWHRLDSSEE